MPNPNQNPEQLARDTIDQQLCDSGWVVQKKTEISHTTCEELIATSLCPLPEQQEIVRLIDEQFTAIEQNEKEIDHSLTQSKALRQSILKKAFTGQLVPQDPTHAPASALLERIREERELGAKQGQKVFFDRIKH